MKASKFDNWELNDTTRPLLFWIQSMEEMLFHYGHDSYKVPTLNFHFLCVEVLSSITKIEREIVDKGNMKPLFEELEAMFQNDVVAQELYGNNFNALFFVKNEQGEYSRDISKLRKNPGEDYSIKIIQRTLLYLLDDMSIENKYLRTLKRLIESILRHTEDFDDDQQRKLLALSKLLLTELLNIGYSQEFIYTCIMKRFYSLNHKVKDIDDEIKCIWSWFDFKKKKYTVMLPVKKADNKKLLEHFKNIRVKDNKNHYFGDSCRWIVEVDVEALEPEKAREDATSLICLFAALKQYSSHISKAYYARQAIVIEAETDTEYIANKPVRLMSRRRNQSEQQTLNRVGELVTTFPVLGDKIINVINLHTSAMESRNDSNQLLNLWTIVEVLVEIDKRNGYSKITQISNTLTTVLNRNYIRSLMEQLIIDLGLCECDINGVLDKIQCGNDYVEKVIALLVLKDYCPEFDCLVSCLSQYPLLVYRLRHYKQVLSSRKNLKKYLEAHRKRLEWQIMRIYRNRNMIVHDGSHFRYIDLILQNLHYYTDSLVDTIIQYIEKGYDSLETIYACLGAEEYRHLMRLEEESEKNTDSQTGNNNGDIPARVEDFVTVILGEEQSRIKPIEF